MIWLKRIGITLAALILAAVAFVGYCYFSYRSEMNIDMARGINEAGYVKIGGIDQWIQIRGRDRNNPVLLWLTGGPGFSQIPRTFFYRSWEKDFTVVLWDQRGEGKTFERSGTSVAKTMTIAQMTSDGIGVAEYLCNHLHKEKIILLGHSWGSMVGVHMVHARPNLFSAYVGTGQVTNLEKQAEASYPLLIERARKFGNKVAEQQLVSVGPPPYPSENSTKLVWVSWANQLDPMPKPSLSSPGGLWAGLNLVLRAPRGDLPPPDALFSQSIMWHEIMNDDLPKLGLQFEVPVVFILGKEDLVTDAALSEKYFSQIVAPSKKLVILPNIGHLAIIYEPDRFLSELIAYVRPFEKVPGETHP